VLQAKVEAEVAFVIGRDLDLPGASPAEVMRAVEFAAAGHRDRGQPHRELEHQAARTAVADNASSGLFVVGNEPRRLAKVDLRLAGMVMERRGEEVSTGAGCGLPRAPGRTRRCGSRASCVE
jgi:2-keto-4-pentenoate hydratase